MYNWKPKLAEVDSENPNAWARCDRCSMITNIDKMVWQWDFRGTPQPINTRILTCGRPGCLDVPQPQNSPIILSPDPEPVFNARPYPYVLADDSFLVTEEGDILQAEDDDVFVTPIPNPDSNAATAYLQSSIEAPGGSVVTLYLDIFNGNPAAGGVSVLEQITGSATRTDIAADLSIVATGIYKNPDTIIVTLESGATVNTNWIGIYSASISGALLMSGECNVYGPFVTVGNPVVFSALDLVINVNL